MSHQAEQKIQEAEIQAVVIRKDGTREDLGTISYWHKNPLKRAMWALKQKATRGGEHGDTRR